MKASRRQLSLLGVAVIATMAIAIPVIAADPSPSSAPPGQTKPDKSPKPDKAASPGQGHKPDKAAKPDKSEAPETPVSVQGTVQQGTDGTGRPTFTVTAGGKTWELSAGPPWYWGDNNPLKAYVGKSVTIAGSTDEGSTELDVETVNGTAIRAAGKPPWAGGPWVVGPTHPGWKSWMADGKPGHGKDKAAHPAESEKPGS